jgi:hypothetical protein
MSYPWIPLLVLVGFIACWIHGFYTGASWGRQQEWKRRAAEAAETARRAASRAAPAASPKDPRV